LVVQDRKQQRCFVKIHTRNQFKVLFKKYRDHAIGTGLIEPGADLVFIYDDEPIEESDTPESLECEPDDIIDVVCNQKESKDD